MDLRLAPRWFVPIAVFGLALSSAGNVRARPCAADEDCPRGFMCLASGTNADGGVVQRCVSLSCQSDSDCGPGTRCEPNAGIQCTTPPDGGQACGACAPQWEVRCSTDIDCGPGFTCSGNTGFYACGPKQSAVPVPPYATVTVIPCADVHKPPPIVPPCGTDAGGIVCAPVICEAGSSCLSISWKTCMAQAPPTCTVDSDCPPTWTCQSPASSGVSFDGGGISIDAAVLAGLGGRCMAPNSDLSPNAGLSFGGSEIPSTVVTDAGGTAIHHASSAATRIGPSAQGGCQLGGRAPTPPNVWILFAALSWVWWARMRKAANTRRTRFRHACLGPRAD